MRGWPDSEVSGECFSQWCQEYSNQDRVIVDSSFVETISAGCKPVDVSFRRNRFRVVMRLADRNLTSVPINVFKPENVVKDVVNRRLHKKVHDGRSALQRGTERSIVILGLTLWFVVGVEIML